VSCGQGFCAGGSDGQYCADNITNCAAISPALTNTDFTARCKCQTDLIEEKTSPCPQCFSVSLGNAAACISLGLLSRAIVPSVYDFKTCSACFGGSVPGTDDYWPAACTKAMTNFIDRLLPATRTLQNALPTIPEACSTLYNFYTEFGNCGIKGLNEDNLKSYVCNPQYGARYSLCQCGGDKVSPLGKVIIAAFTDINLRNEIAAYINKYDTGNSVTLDYTTTYPCRADRIYLEFTANINFTAIQNAWADYLGIPRRRVIVGVGIQQGTQAGECVAVVSYQNTPLVKRGEQVTQATLQIVDSASTFVLSQLVVLLCALVYFM